MYYLQTKGENEMKETIKEISYYQTQALALEMLLSKVRAKLQYIYKNEDLEAIKHIISDEELLATEYKFTDDEQREAIKEITGKDLTYEEFRNEVFGDMDE